MQVSTIDEKAIGLSEHEEYAKSISEGAPADTNDVVLPESLVGVTDDDIVVMDKRITKRIDFIIMPVSVIFGQCSPIGKLITVASRSLSCFVSGIQKQPRSPTIVAHHTFHFCSRRRTELPRPTEHRVCQARRHHGRPQPFHHSIQFSRFYPLRRVHRFPSAFQHDHWQNLSSSVVHLSGLYRLGNRLGVDGGGTQLRRVDDVPSRAGYHRGGFRESNNGDSFRSVTRSADNIPVYLQFPGAIFYLSCWYT